MADAILLKKQDVSVGKEEVQNTSEVDKPAPTHKWYHLNVSILPAKLSFFFENGKRIGFTPNMVLFFTSIGLNKAQAGFIVGFRLIGMMLGGPFWGMLADKTHRHKLIVTTLCIVAVLFTCSQPFISLPYGNSVQNVCPESVSNATVNVTFPNMSSVNYPTENNEIFYSKRLLAILFALNLIACFFDGSLSTFIDTAVVRRIHLSVDRPVEYGKQRMCGSIGAAVGIAVTNWLVDLFPEANITCYTAIFIAYFVFTLLEYISIVLLYRGLSFSEMNKICKESQSIPKDKFYILLKKTLTRFDVLFFYVGVLVLGIIYAQYTSFVMVYIKEIGGSRVLMTISMVISSLSGITSLYFAADIIQILGGAWRTLAFTFFCYFVRYMICYLITNPWLIILPQILHSVTSILSVVASITHLKSITQPEILATMCALFNSLHYGVGNIIGSSLGGLVYEEYGGRILFLCASLIGLLWSAVFVVYICAKKRGMHSRNGDTDVGIELVEKTNL